MNEQGRATLNCAEECAIDSRGQESHFMMQKEQHRKNLYTDLKERKITSRETDQEHV